MRVLIPLAALTATLFGAPVGAAAQEPPIADAPRCTTGPVVGDLGYNGLSCNCTHYFDPDNPLERRWEFRSEPTIFGIKPDGPADGALQPGDVIVAIDGHLITTREGGRRFAQIEPGKPVRLRVRRDGREVNVTIVPTGRCVRAAPAAPAVGVSPARGVGVAAAPRPPAPPTPDTVAVTAPAPPRPRRPGAVVAVAPRAALPPRPPAVETLPRGWLGVSVSCSDCAISVSGVGRPEWHFSSPPLIEAVERGSPAYRAGIRGGDRLTHIDGVDITTDDGGRRFGAVRPGQRVELQYERGGRSFGTAVVAGERELTVETPSPERRGGVAQVEPGVAVSGRRVVAVAPQPGVVRFSGLLGDTFIEVTGAPVTVIETETEIIIRSAEITVRVRRAVEDEGR